ncbi:MAG: cytochrome c oxidase subunit 3 [Panacagrimonas sp.]
MSTVMQEARSGKPRHLPGEPGVWIFILGDMTIFALFFMTFIFYRAQDPALFLESRTHLNQHFGALNTLLLLASSWFVIMAVNAARKRMTHIATRLFSAAWLCGLGFVVVKYFEWGEKISAGITLTTNDFFMYYYVFTGIHLLHLLIGLGVLAFLISISRRGNFDDRNMMMLEGGASFWHMVDLLWIVLFPLLYMFQ